MKAFKTLRYICAMALLGSLAHAHADANYPSKPIRWVVGTAAGGGSDFVVRTVAEKLSQQLGQPIVVENRPGGGTTIAADTVARAPADGYTILTADTGTLVFNTALFRKLPYEPSRDFAPVGMLASFPLLLVTRSGSPYASAKAIVDAVRTKPGVYGYASAGVGSPHHVAMEFFKDQAKLDLQHVPYRGAAPAVQDLVAGTVPFGVIDSAAGHAMLRAGRLRAVATFTKARVPTLPDVPTLMELKLADAEAPCWISVVAPSQTPMPILEKLSTELANAVRHPDVQKKLREAGLEPQPSTRAQMQAVWQQADTFWPQLIRRQGITVE